MKRLGSSELILMAACFVVPRQAAAQEQELPSATDNPQYLLEQFAPFARISTVRNEVNLNNVQIHDLEQIDQNARKSFERLDEISPLLESPEQRKALWDSYETTRIWLRLQADAVLTPEQLTRFKQLASQYITRDPSRTFGLLARDMREKLALSEKQIQDLRDKSVALDERLRRCEAELKLELERTRVQLRAELIETLKPERREVLRQVWGELLPIPD